MGVEDVGEASNGFIYESRGGGREDQLASNERRRQGEEVDGNELELTFGSSYDLLHARHAPIQRPILLQDSQIDVVRCTCENESVCGFGGRIGEPSDGETSREEGR